MGLAARVETSGPEGDDRYRAEEPADDTLTEDEALAKKMAERSWAERQEEPEGLKRIKRLGKQLAPDRMSAHLAVRFGARLALLEAFRDNREQLIAKGKATPMEMGQPAVPTIEARMSIHQQAQVWRFLQSQTQVGLEWPVWSALDCLGQREFCGRACLGRAPLDREAWVVGKKSERLYVVLRGTAGVLEAREEGGAPTASKMATEEVDGDFAMTEGPHWCRTPDNDIRTASHAFGSLKVPEAVDHAIKHAVSDARKLRTFLKREIANALDFDEVLCKAGFPPESGLVHTPRPGEEPTFLTAAVLEEEPSEDEVSDDEAEVAALQETYAAEGALGDVDHAEAQRVMAKLDVMSKNNRLATVEIEAALSGFPDKAFGGFLLEQFKALDVNSDGEIELAELVECCRRWRKLRRDEERIVERKAARQKRREAKWARALKKQAKPSYVFGPDGAPDEEDNDESWRDWTWDKPLAAKFSAGAEYLSFRTGRSWDRVWASALEPVPAPGPPGRLTPSEVLALRARGLGFLAPHACIREYDCNDMFIDEGTRPSEVFLTLEGTVAIERRRELDEDDDAGVWASEKQGLFRDTVTLAILQAPVLIGEFASLSNFNRKQYCKVTALGDLPVPPGTNDDDDKLDAALKDLDPSTGEKTIRKGTRCLTIPTKLFETLLASRPAEKLALERAALVKRQWLDERKKHRCQVRRERNRARKERRDVQLEAVASEGDSSRYWKLWSCGAVLAKGEKDVPSRAEMLRVEGFDNPLKAPPSFFSGAVLDFDEAQLAMELTVDPPDQGDVEDAAARARMIRMEVSLAETGALGSFSLPGLFDELEDEQGVKSPLKGWAEVLPETREAFLPPHEHDFQLRKEKVRPPSLKQLEKVARTPFLMPYPSMTSNRTLLGVNLPTTTRLELPVSKFDDSAPPVLDLQARRSLAAVGLARRRARLGKREMRDPRVEVRRHRKLLGGFPGTYKPKPAEFEQAFRFKPPLPASEKSAVLAGPGHKAARPRVPDRDRTSIHANLGDALGSLVGVRGSRVDALSHDFAETRREDAAALREAKTMGHYREPWEPAPELLRSTQEVLAAGLVKMRTSARQPVVFQELSPRRAAAALGAMSRMAPSLSRTSSYEDSAAPPPDRTSTPGPVFRFQAATPLPTRAATRGSKKSPHPATARGGGS